MPTLRGESVVPPRAPLPARGPAGSRGPGPRGARERTARRRQRQAGPHPAVGPPITSTVVSKLIEAHCSVLARLSAGCGVKASQIPSGRPVRRWPGMGGRAVATRGCPEVQPGPEARRSREGSTRARADAACGSTHALAALCARARHHAKLGRELGTRPRAGRRAATKRPLAAPYWVHAPSVVDKVRARDTRSTTRCAQPSGSSSC